MKSRLLSAAGVSALALAPVLGLAPPAAAAVVVSQCSAEQRRELDTPGFNTDLNIHVCVERDSTGVYRSEVRFRWNESGPNKFMYMKLHSRLEKYDVVVKGAVCDFTNAMDSEYGNRECQTVWASGTPGLMTADATLVYDIAGDSSGERTQDLHGSPAI
ncbi:hypothetical protein ACFWPV_39375, partial [Streptomyces uncialis]|uniref:hypothetical protein n=1 Tax=Streptomyces uncialis TaxID=1048205 RepID=UPI00364DCAE5